MNLYIMIYRYICVNIFIYMFILINIYIIIYLYEYVNIYIYIKPRNASNTTVLDDTTCLECTIAYKTCATGEDIGTPARSGA